MRRLHDPTEAVRAAPALPGRGRSLARLVAGARSLDEGGGPVFHLIEAGPGLGKTRLLDAALDVLVGSGYRCVLAPSEPGQEPYRTAVRLARQLSLPSAHLLDTRLDLASVPVDRAHADQRAAFGQLSGQLLEGCRDQPTVIALDDLHWMDPASAAFCEVVVDDALASLGPAPLLVVLAHRPLSPGSPVAGLVERLRAEPGTVAEELAPLDGADLFEAMEQLLPSAPSATFQAMVQRASDGNPLRMRAALETLRRRGVPPDIGADDRRAQGTIEVWTAPSADPIQNWIDTLDREAQGVLGAAGLLAAEFTAEEAATMAAVGPAEVDQALDAAHALQLIGTDGTLHWFAHAMIRDELIRRLSMSRRARIRQRAVALERSRAGVDPGAWARAAEHILLSGGSGGPADGGNLEVLRSATDWASGVGAWAAAGRYAEAALDVARRLGRPADERANLELLAAEAHHFNLDFEAARRRLQGLLNELSSFDDATRGRILRLSVRTEMLASAQMGGARMDIGPLTAFAATADPLERARSLQLLVECELANNLLDEARSHARQAVEAAEQATDHRTVSLCHHSVGFVSLTAVDMRTAEQAYRRMYDSAARAGDGWLMSEALARKPFISLVAGDLAETDRRSDDASATAARYGQYVSQCLAECTRASVALLRGDLAAVELHGSRARSRMHRCGYLGALQHFYPAWLRTRLLLDDRPGAERLLRQWAQDGGSTAPPPKRYQELVDGPGAHRRASGSSGAARQLTQFGLGFAALQAGLAVAAGDGRDLEPLLALLELGVDSGVVFGMNWPVSLARVLGDGCLLLGDTATAARRYRTAIEQCTRVGAHTEAALALLALALIDDRSVSADERRQAGAEAYHLASRLGLAEVAVAAAAATNRAIDLEAHVTDPGYRVVLMSDIVGSTPLSVESGDRAYHDVVMLHHRLVRASLADHGGIEFSEGGDSLLAWFGDQAAAVACALDIQARLAAARRTGADCRARIGLAGGVPFEHGGRPYGAVVNLAARICALAGADQVVVPEPLLTGPAGELPARPMGPFTLKGFPGERLLFVIGNGVNGGRQDVVT